MVCIVDYVKNKIAPMADLKARTIINRAHSAQNLSAAIYGMPGFFE